MIIEIFLNFVPSAAVEQMDGMGDGQSGVSIFFQDLSCQGHKMLSLEQAQCIPGPENEFGHNGCHHRVLPETAHFVQGKHRTILHGLLEHPPGTPVLLRQLLFQLLEPQNIGILLELGRDGFQAFAVLGTDNGGASLPVHFQTKDPFPNRSVFEQLPAVLHQFGLHPKRQTHGVRKMRIGGQIPQSGLHPFFSLAERWEPNWRLSFRNCWRYRYRWIRSCSFSRGMMS